MSENFTFCIKTKLINIFRTCYCLITNNQTLADICEDFQKWGEAGATCDSEDINKSLKIYDYQQLPNFRAYLVSWHLHFKMSTKI